MNRTSIGNPYVMRLGLSAIVALGLAVPALATTQADEGGGLGASGATGEPSAHRPRPPITVPEGLTDELLPAPTAAAIVDPPQLDESDAAIPAPAEPPALLSQRLAGLDAARRANAVIELELPGPASAAAQAEAEKIAALWNGGEFAPALDRFEALEAAGIAAGVGIAWRTPIAAEAMGPGGLDVRIGAPRTGASLAALDYDAETGHLFAVLNWTGPDAGWSANISTDGGATWSETYFWFTPGAVIDVDAAVVDAYLYVGYVSTPFDTGRLRRQLVTDGSSDGAYSFQTVISAAPNTLLDIAVAANADDFDNRIYYAAIESDGTVHWNWDVATDGTTFTNESPGVANGASGLDMHWNKGSVNIGDYYVFLSYVDTGSAVHVLRHESVLWDDTVVEAAYSGTSGATSVSVHEDTVICAFEEAYAGGVFTQYEISYDEGVSWNFGFSPPASGIFPRCHVTARGGAGTALVFDQEVGEPDDVLFQRRGGYAPGLWDDPVTFNNFDVSTGSALVINALPLAGLAETIETLASWDGVETVGSFGEPNTATYGQTFIAPCDSVLASFTVFIDDNVNPDAIDFAAYVMAWDAANSRATGPVLYASAAVSTTNNGGAGGLEEFTLQTGGIQLTGGTTYVAFLSASSFFDASTGTGSMGRLATSAYADGQFVFNNNGADFGALTTTAWNTSFGGDLAFEMTFDAAPWSYGMIYLGGGGIPYFDRMGGQNDCLADLTGPSPGACPDGVVNVFDLLALLANFGNSPPLDTTGDITGPNPGDPSDGVVNVFDLLALLAVFGNACPTP